MLNTITIIKSIPKYKLYSGNGNKFAVIFDEIPFRNKRRIVTYIAQNEPLIDGIIFLNSKNNFMDIWDKDGTHENMCGNALLISAFLLQKLGTINQKGIVNTLDGPKKVFVKDDKVIAKIGYPKELSNGVINVAGVPHFITFEEESEETAKKIKEKLGEVNINFVKIKNDKIYNHTYEVGVGWTEACGTGATAVAFYLKKNCEINFPGGIIYAFEKDGCYFIQGKVKEIEPISIVQQVKITPLIQSHSEN